MFGSCWKDDEKIVSQTKLSTDVNKEKQNLADIGRCTDERKLQNERVTGSVFTADDATNYTAQDISRKVAS
jgi:hypothetical protein